MACPTFCCSSIEASSSIYHARHMHILCFVTSKLIHCYTLSMYCVWRFCTCMACAKSPSICMHVTKPLSGADFCPFTGLFLVNKARVSPCVMACKCEVCMTSNCTIDADIYMSDQVLVYAAGQWTAYPQASPRASAKKLNAGYPEGK